MGRVIITRAVVSAGQLAPAREPGPSKDSRRSETAQTVASAGQFVPVMESGSSKDLRRSKTAQAVALMEQSCLPGNTGQVKVQGVRRLLKL